MNIDQLKKTSSEALEAAKTEQDLEKWRIAYLGKKGKISQLAKTLQTLPPQKRPQTGRQLNQLKKLILVEFEKKKRKLNLTLEQKKWLDPTLPAILPPIGHLHPITLTIREIVSIFEGIGYQRVSYPEVEWDYFAFEALNMPKDHPARDEWETFFVSDKIVLTPHTSSGQVREMLSQKPPIRMLNIAKCYRRQQDVSHVPMFFQFEGLFIDRQASIANLKGTLDYFTTCFFGPKRITRIRPYHFRFTEPSFEVDVSCGVCNGHGCKLCKAGWLELGGAGMVHPKVLKAGRIDSSQYTGFAFGWGVERVCMMKTNISDIRLFYQNDIRFLEQF